MKSLVRLLSFCSSSPDAKCQLMNTKEVSPTLKLMPTPPLFPIELRSPVATWLLCILVINGMTRIEANTTKWIPMREHELTTWYSGPRHSCIDSTHLSLLAPKADLNMVLSHSSDPIA